MILTLQMRQSRDAGQPRPPSISDAAAQLQSSASIGARSLASCGIVRAPNYFGQLEQADAQNQRKRKAARVGGPL